MGIKYIPRWIYLSVKRVVLSIELKMLERKVQKMDEQKVVFDAIKNMGVRGHQVLVYFNRYYKKPRGLSHNLVYLWPKKTLHQVFSNNGIEVSDTPDYEVAFNQLLDKVYGEDKHETHYVES